jgi:sugar phosphate isomerase/epimerase
VPPDVGGIVVLLCFHGTLVRGERLALEERMALARRTGYQAIDFDYREVERVLADRPGLETAAFWRQSGLQPGMAGGVPLPDPFASDEEFAARLAEVPAKAHAAAAAGARLVGLVLRNRSRLPEAEARVLVRQRLRRIAEVLAPAGLSLAVEFIGVRTLWPDLPYPFAQRYTDVLGLLEETGCANVGLLLDSYHWYGAEATLEDVAATPKERILYLHVNDCKPGPAAAIQDADRLIPGEGVIDLAGWFRAVARTGFDGCVAPEVLGPRLQGMTSEQAATACRDGILAALRRAGL